MPSVCMAVCLLSGVEHFAGSAKNTVVASRSRSFMPVMGHSFLVLLTGHAQFNAYAAIAAPITGTITARDPHIINPNCDNIWELFTTILRLNDDTITE